MAKNITKSVIEDIAYELKRVGLAVHAYNTGTMPEDTKDDFDLDLSDPEDVLDWVIENMHEVIATHDPSFDSARFRNQASYKITE